jgi:hypothetical protein
VTCGALERRAIRIAVAAGFEHDLIKPVEITVLHALLRSPGPAAPIPGRGSGDRLSAGE